jgi:hypothetical protein
VVIYLSICSCLQRKLLIYKNNGKRTAAFYFPIIMKILCSFHLLVYNKNIRTSYILGRMFLIFFKKFFPVLYIVSEKAKNMKT